MPMPDFLIIGAPKSGTTSLYFYLQQHPQIYMSVHKEPCFFIADSASELPSSLPPGSVWRSRSPHAAYEQLFASVPSEQIAGEASTQYLSSSVAPRLIHTHIPQARLVAILRQPVDRAYSQYLHNRRNGIEPLSTFQQALQAEDARRHKQTVPLDVFYKQSSMYVPQIQRYLALFPREQIRFYLYDDLRHDPQGVVRDLFEFLGVDDTFRPDMSEQYNVSGVPKNRFLFNLANRRSPPLVRLVLRAIGSDYTLLRIKQVILRGLQQPAPRLNRQFRQELTREFHDDILCLQELLQRDLSMWLAE